MIPLFNAISTYKSTARVRARICGMWATGTISRKGNATATQQRFVSNNGPPKNKVALVLGVANQRSIAWACVQALLKKDYEIILTYQHGKHKGRIETMAEPYSNIIGCFQCDVQQHELPNLFQQHIRDTLNGRKLDAMVHSIAFAENIHVPLMDTSLQSFLLAHHVSAYSFLEMVRCSQPLLSETASVVALTYLGSSRSVPGYNVMGPAKASLESIVRGLSKDVRCNAVSAGPLKTVSARGIPQFGLLQEHVQRHVGKNVELQTVAHTVAHLCSPESSGIRGQVIFVDEGYSSIVPVQ